MLSTTEEHSNVLLHQTVIGQEALAQLEMAGDYPDIVVGCTGGGSNFAGIAFPFLGAKLRGEREVEIIAVEPAACPTLTRGKYAYDFGDTAHLTPLVKMHTLGSTFVPEGIHAGGLRYHGMAPLVSHVVNLGLAQPRSEYQLHHEMPGWKAAIASFTQSGGYANLSDRIAQVNHPTLILWGEADDVLGTDDATKFEQAISGSQLIWIPEAGHVPHFDRPQSVAAHMLTFARRIRS
ncbi:pyridoxal-phosphate dependent enzyme [Microcoleus sp. ZQ-A2]